MSRDPRQEVPASATEDTDAQTPRRLRVAVVITSRDRPAWVRRALDGVLAQRRPADEIVVVDDGSSPPLDPAALAGATLVRAETSVGASAARNLGAAATSGEILMFLDDDDLWTVEKLEAQAAIMEADPDAVIVYSGRAIVRDSKPEVVVRRVASRIEGRVMPRLWTDNVVGVTSSVALRRTAFDAAGGWDEQAPLRLDYDLWLRVAPRGTVRWDGGHHVRYTVFDEPGRQLSAQRARNRAGVRYLLEKYDACIDALGFLPARRARAEKWYSAARQLRRTSWLAALPFVLRGTLQYPRLRGLALLLPRAVLTRLGF